MNQPPTLAFLAWAVETARDATDPAIVAGRDATAAWLAGQVTGSLDNALGLAPAPGERTHATKTALRRRDDLYLAMAAAHFSADTRRGRAATIHAALVDYSGRGWLRERGHPCRHVEGSLPFFLWSIMSAHEAASNVRPARPLSAPQIDRLLQSSERRKTPARR